MAGILQARGLFDKQIWWPRLNLECVFSLTMRNADTAMKRTNPISGIYCPQNLEEVNIYNILVAENSIE